MSQVLSTSCWRFWQPIKKSEWRSPNTKKISLIWRYHLTKMLVFGLWKEPGVTGENPPNSSTSCCWLIHSIRNDLFCQDHSSFLLNIGVWIVWKLPQNPEKNGYLKYHMWFHVFKPFLKLWRSGVECSDCYLFMCFCVKGNLFLVALISTWTFSVCVLVQMPPLSWSLTKATMPAWCKSPWVKTTWPQRRLSGTCTALCQTIRLSKTLQASLPWDESSLPTLTETQRSDTVR